METESSFSFLIRPLVTYCNRSLVRHQDRHLMVSAEFAPGDGALFELSRRSFFRLFRCRLIAPLKIESIVTCGGALAAVPRLRSCRNRHSREFGANVSLMKAMRDGDV